VNDLREIAAYVEGEWGVEFAQRTEDELYDCFERVALDPGLGHRRRDLTSRPFHFFARNPYLIVYVRDETRVSIMRVLHGARNVKKILRTHTRI
jgi:plasmid stabilization system protein ParE